VSNTTIQSVPYNALVDDLTADANAARPITAGGTGATSASAARTALGLAIGTNVQAYDAGLASIAGLTTAADRMIYTTASDVYATTALTPFARTLLDDTTAGSVLTTLGVSTFIQTLLDDTSAATARATLGANNASNLTTGTTANSILPARLQNQPTAINDCNAVTETGWYRVNSSSANAPETATLLLMHVAWSDTQARQICMRHSSNIIYERCNVSGTWSSWYKVWTEASAIPIGNVSGLDAARTWSTTQTFSDLRLATGTRLDFTTGGGNDYISYDDSTNTYSFFSDTSIGGTTLEYGKVRLLDNNDASLSSTAHPFQIGDTSSVNIIADNNEIMARNNGATSPLILQGDGGLVQIGPDGASTSGSITATGGLATSGTTASGRYVSVSDATGPEYTLNANGVRVARIWFDTAADTLYMRRYVQGTGANSGVIEIRGPGVDDFKYNGSTVFHAANTTLGTLAAMNLTDLFYTGSSTSNTVFPVGSIIAIRSTETINRNASVGVNLSSADTQQFFNSTHPSAGTALSGTWRQRGRAEDGNFFYLMQRVA
jgi:hypothetical protein